MADRRTDAELVSAGLEGSQEAFGALVARYKDAVFGVAYHRLGDFEDARDAAQDALLKAFTNLGKLREPRAFANWLYRIADGTALDRARRRRRELSLDEAAQVPSPGAAAPPAADSDIARMVREALDTLSDASRLAVILHYINGYSHAEVAEFLGATEGAVKTRVSRAKSRLREEMAEMVEDRLKRESSLFLFEAEDDDGRLITGQANAVSAAAIRRRLATKGYRVKQVRPDTRTPEERLAEEREAVTRVAHVILEQGLKDEAREIRITLPRAGGDDEPMRVWYLVGDTWHEVMAMPTYIWETLRPKLAEMAGITLASPYKRQTGTIAFSHESTTRALRIALNRKSIRVETQVHPERST